MDAMHARTIISDTWQTHASENVDTHNVICAIDELVQDTTERACLNGHELVDWCEYREIEL